MATSLAAIRAKLQQQETKSQGNSGGDKAIYPHWNIPEGTSAVLRFLPDGNKDNTFFWAERAMIKLPFAGIKGQADSKPVIVQVPCMEMWGESCPILAEVRTWFKDKALEEMGRKYWKKRSYIYQGFVRKDPLGEDSPENPIRRFVMSPSLFPLIKAALMDPELEELPTDNVHGIDFTITKTSKGGYADYATSKWSRKESALTEAELAAIEQFGLFDLASFLPKKPGDVELKIMKEMFEASVDGQAYDPDMWSNYFKPAGLGGSGTTTGSTTSPAVVAADDDAEPVVAATPKTEVKTAKVEEAKAGGQKAQDILALIRSRQPKTS